MLREVEQLAVISIPVLCMLAFSQYSGRMLYQFAILIVSQYISILIPSLIPYLVVCLALIVLIKSLGAGSQNVKKNIEPRLFFDLARFITITQTTICIFLCDFDFWDSRFSKNDGYSIGLMDLGVGCFMFNGGVTSCRIARRKMIRSTVLLFLLGLLRLLAIGAFNLHVNPKEYGIHWNFYFTLSAVNFLYILSSLLLNNSCSKLLLGIALVIGYELASPQVSDLIFRAERSNMLLQNKEGLCSLVPFLGFFLILNHIGSLILERNLKKATANLSMLWCINTAVYVVARTYSCASRRLCNLAYLSWVLFIQFTFIWLFMKAAHHCPYLINNTGFFKLCSQNILHVFLFSNLLVLLFKLYFDLSSMTYVAGNALNLAYLFLSFVALPKILGMQTSHCKTTAN
ncbi:uncharacterized protein VICG_01615 [Vittaforma corneae ATCC 50505]|uniref:GPI-anchored wall transfer protein n=1 Tax=Vittaforma corneae (strain ATCC 50505) TaxID=993615 RepID=L2GL55_VITCO|nr:uncharacterized protein VICG_01615 [Vittaforma corneae ATCC 50505]ELA41374.1 hypothetical protein VICG_01615 [Vittaforma corneae ATCC 50505]